MIRFWRSPLLVIALVAFAFQVGTAANVRCELAATHAAQHPGSHAGHHQGSSNSHTPVHQSGCVCVAGCGVAFKLAGTTVEAPLANIRIRWAPDAEAAPVDLLPLAARPFALPLAHAPPFLV
jgi:hypothetical protein